ncbi:MAG: TetR family transcriptional regulator [Pseudonocardia sp.]
MASESWLGADDAPRPRATGRPVATSHAEIEEAAFRLFESQGFDKTTLDSISAEVGITKRTFFRYFDSKNDIPWGRFEVQVSRFREYLQLAPMNRPVHACLHDAVRLFNDFDADEAARVRRRLTLVAVTPTLQAHTALMYEPWRGVVAQFVADRLHVDEQDHFPVLAGRITLALMLAAYDEWLRRPSCTPADLVDRSFERLADFLDA